jgi:hypothetical protein
MKTLHFRQKAEANGQLRLDISVGKADAESPSAPAETAGASLSSNDLHLRVAWDQLIDRLISISVLQENWDGEGSVAPDAGAVEGATNLALILKTQQYIPADRVTASVNGTVVFEWHLPQEYQEIEVVSKLDAELRSVPKGSRAAEVTPIRIG